uniref:ABC transmembrane type-1 domain-containing protein n=1 Tax=Aegilops tauschii subsp. strangulata TaxID=200361 RepID=A0A453RXZ2_AEGTS
MCAQTISHIKTVFSFVGENSAMKSFIECMDKQYKLGKKEAITKGLGLGMLQIATFCSYSLTIYIGALAVTRRSCDVTPADIFICNFRYLSNAAPDLQTSCAVASAFLRFAPLLVRNGPERRRRRSSEMRRRNIRGNAHIDPSIYS